jgi:hypothetical protein
LILHFRVIKLRQQGSFKFSSFVLRVGKGREVRVTSRSDIRGDHVLTCEEV